MFLRPLAFALVIALSTGCTNDTRPVSGVDQDDSAVAVDTYGADFDAARAIPAAEITLRYSAEELKDTVQATLRGTVEEVCQAKGCWMTLAVGEDERIMIKFKDYGFFVPKDLGGQTVAMRGMAYTQLTPVDELRHFAADAGASEADIAAITEPAAELHFLADGVRLLPD